MSATGTVPRPHQTEAVDAALAVLVDQPRAQVVMACGTGKTLVGVRVAEDCLGEAGIGVVLVPTVALLYQTLEVYRGEIPGIETLSVCFADDGTTDSREIAGWLAARATRRRVIFSTYDSARAVGTALVAIDRAADLVVCDEAHRMAGDDAKAWAAGLDDRLMPSSRRLFLTATPRVHDPDRVDGDLVASMDDESIFGPVAYTLSFAEAIQRDLLSDYRMVVAAVRDTDVLGRLMRDSVASDDLPATARDLAILDAAARWGMRSILAFCNSVASSQRLVGHLAAVNADRVGGSIPLEAIHIDAATPVPERMAALARLRTPGESVVVVSNCRLMSEGVDVPALDGVVFVEPRTSSVDVAQAVGRALRHHPGGGVSTIMVPFWVGEGETPEAALAGSAWSQVGRVVAALADHDSRLVGWLTAQAARPEGELLSDEDAPEVRFEGVSAAEVAAIQRAISLRVLRATGRGVDLVFARVEAWVREHGTAAIPDTARDDLGALGIRVAILKHEHRYDRPLTGEWVMRFEALPGWSWGARQVPRDERLRLLAERVESFVAAHGWDALRTTTRDDHGSLGVSVRKLQAQRRAGRTLPVDVVARLEAIDGFTWGEPRREEGETLRRLAVRAEAFAAAHGRAPTTRDRDAEGRLGASLQVTVKQKQKQGLLGEQWVRRFEAIQGWRWAGDAGETRTEAAMERSYARVVAWAGEHGSAAIRQVRPRRAGVARRDGAAPAEIAPGGEAGSRVGAPIFRASGMVVGSGDPLTPERSRTCRPTAGCWSCSRCRSRCW